VYPNKGSDNPRIIAGTDVPLEGEVFVLLQDVYGKAERDCVIDIAFDRAVDGAARNDCRTLLLHYAGAPSVDAGLPLATRLGSFSTRRSALGLLFIATGMVGQQRKIVIARFAAHNGILADENREALSVQFVERVFLKSVGSYKAALFQDSVNDTGFWTGKAVDKQITSGEAEVSRYWITEFLASDFRTTSATGTRVLAAAMRNAAKITGDLDIKKEITAAATLGAGLNDQVMTAGDFIGRFGLSQQARDAIVGQMRHPGLLTEQFRFNAEEFNRQLPYKSVELNSGAILTAAAPEFDNVFEHSEPDENGEVTYSATGRVVSTKFERVSR
jgi:hypothetical protein